MFKLYKKITIPDEKELVFCTDLHGQFNQLMQIFIDNKFDLDTQIVCTGDIIDRGKTSLPLLLNFLNNENYHMTLGNHELGLIYANYSKDDLTFWHSIGGKNTFNELGKSGVKYMSQRLLEEIPLILEIEHRGMKFGITHTCIPTKKGKYITEWDDFIHEVSHNEEYRNNLIYGERRYFTMFDDFNRKRKDFKLPDDVPVINGIDYILHGHYGTKDIFQLSNQIWFDTWYLSETTDEDREFTLLRSTGNKNNPFDILRG